MPKQTHRRTEAFPTNQTNPAHHAARQLAVIDTDGRDVTLRPLAEALSSNTRAMLVAIENGGRQ